MPTYNQLATISGNTTFSLATFSGIPNTYKDLRVVWSTWGEGQRQNMCIRFNGNTSTNIWTVEMYGQAASPNQGRSANAGLGYAGYQCVSNATSIGFGIIDIPGYNIASTTHSYLAYACFPADSLPTIYQSCGYVDNLDAITSITLFKENVSNWGNNFRATLFGLGA